MLIYITWSLVIQEIKNSIYNKSFIFLTIGLFLYPYILFLLTFKSYVFRDALDVFTFMFEGILPLLFVFLTVIIYVSKFSRLLKDRFIIYLRMRAPLKQILSAGLISNTILTFLLFTTFTFSLFLFSFYIEPIFSLVNYQPEVYLLTHESTILDSYNRHTFTQLLERGNFIYGLSYSIWIGFNAVVYSSLGFFAILLTQNLIGLAFPVLFYLIGTFIFGYSEALTPYRMADTIFPFSVTQQSISSSLLVGGILLIINLFLYLFTFKIKINSLENTL